MTKAKDTAPTKRLMMTKDGEVLVVELSERVIAIRPFGCRKNGPAAREITVGALYQRLVAGDRNLLPRKMKR